MNNKKAQQAMGMSFKMIFAIFLIAVFIAFAFMAIRGFLDIGKSASVGMFYEELQDAVDEALQSQSSESTFKINLPKELEQICFANLSATRTTNQEEYNLIKRYEVYEANTFLLPREFAQNMEWKLIDGLDIDKIITEKGNPYCIDIKDDLVLEKGFYSRGVSIEAVTE